MISSQPCAGASVKLVLKSKSGVLLITVLDLAPSLDRRPGLRERSEMASLTIALIILIVVALAIVGGRYAIRRPLDAFLLAALTLLIGLPLWLTCDSHLVLMLPQVDWFDPREPFAPYFLLYLPLSFLIAATIAAALIIGVRFDLKHQRR